MPVTVNLPSVPAGVLPVVAWALAGLLLWLWLRRELTPKRFLSIWETDGTLSSRQILAWVVACFGMFMRAGGQFDNEGMQVCFECSFILFGIGGVVKAAGRLKPAANIVQAKKADVTAAGDVNLQTTTTE